MRERVTGVAERVNYNPAGFLESPNVSDFPGSAVISTAAVGVPPTASFVTN
jgi:hypothetical protein